MTREEAIGVIKSECYVFNPLNLDRSTMINTALDMAIQAMEQEPCEDVVSRQAAIDALGEKPLSWTEDEYELGLQNQWQSDVDAIKALPSAQTELIRCKDCGHFHYDMPYVIQGVPVLGHEVCDFWGDGCKTSENGYCSFVEKRDDGRPES